MPRKTGRRKFNRKPRRAARRPAVRTIVKREIKRAEESKAYDGITPGVGIDYGGSVYSLYANASGGSTIGQSVGVAGYVGEWISPSWLSIHGTLTVGDTTNIVRVIVLQVSGVTAPTIANLLQSVGTAQTPLSPFSKTVARYKKLADQLYAVDSTRPFLKWKINVPGSKMRRTHFSDASGTPDNGGLYIYFYSDSAAVTHPNVQYYSRVYYKDS